MRKLSELLKKGIITLSFAITIFAVKGSTALAGNVVVDETNFPDEIFRGYVSEQFDLDQDGFLSEEEIAMVKSICLEGNGSEFSQCHSVKGIEVFTSLTEFSSNSMPLDSIDLSNNENLESISLWYHSNLNNLDISHNKELTRVSCGYCGLSSLNFSENHKLISLYCVGNKFEELDLSNTTLQEVRCSQNQLKKIICSDKNYTIRSLECDSNQLESLDLSNFAALDWLDCAGNQLATLDCSKNLNLTLLECHMNQIETLILNGKIRKVNCSQNKLKSLDLRNCTHIVDLVCTNNQLESIDISNNLALQDIFVNGVESEYSSTITYRIGETSTYYDQSHSISVDQGVIINAGNYVGDINIDECFPDEVFRNYIKQKADSDSDGLLGGLERTLIENISIYGNSNNNCHSLEGIEYLPNLTNIYCTSCDIPTINLSNNKELKELTCTYCNLTELNLDYNTELEELWCDHNPITKLDLRKNKKLKVIHCENDPNNKTITELNVTGCDLVEKIACSYNLVEELDLENKENLESLYVSYNKLNELDVSDSEKLVILSCGGNPIRELEVSMCPLLQELYCAENELTELNTLYNTELVILSCGVNQLTALDISHNVKLKGLYCNRNQITKLDIRKAPKLVDYVVNGTKKEYSYDKNAWQYVSTNGYSWRDYLLVSKDVDLIYEDPKFEIVEQPVDWIGTYGKKASFTVKATGEDITYQWQYKKSGNWIDYAITTADTPVFKVTMNEKNKNWPIRCLITDISGNTLTTNEVWMKLKEEPIVDSIVISTQPVDWIGTYGKKASFSVVATGNELTYQWQYKKSGSWVNYGVTTSDTANFKVTMNEKNVKWPIRCLITDAEGYSVTTVEVHMKLKEENPEPVNNEIVISKQPVDWIGVYGKKASFGVEASGKELTYQWQYKKGTEAWTNYAIATADTANFNVTMNEKNVKWLYRCVITDADGKTVTTNEVHMYLKGAEPAPVTEGPVITGQPSNYTGKIGKKATFTVTVAGDGLTYEWQVKKTGGWSAYTLAGYDTPTFQVSINDKTVKWTYRCVIRDASGKEITTNEVCIRLSE